MKTIHLFAGCGGGMFSDLILGHQPIAAIEWDSWRCQKLKEVFNECEIINADATMVDYSRWAGVDCLKAGIPCPAWSGARRGVGRPPDHTGTVIKAVSECKPEWVFIECVANYKKEHAKMRDGFKRIGYTFARPLILDASCLGAPHIRSRYWALGHSDKHGQSILPKYAKMAMLSPPDCGPWESPADERICIFDGLADEIKTMSALGDGQIPLQAAAAWKILGGK